MRYIKLSLFNAFSRFAGRLAPSYTPTFIVNVINVIIHFIRSLNRRNGRTILPLILYSTLSFFITLPLTSSTSLQCRKYFGIRALVKFQLFAEIYILFRCLFLLSPFRLYSLDRKKHTSFFSDGILYPYEG